MPLPTRLGTVATPETAVEAGAYVPGPVTRQGARPAESTAGMDDDRPLARDRILGPGPPLPRTVTGLRPPLTRPPDFASFWRATLAELDGQDPLVSTRRLATGGSLVLEHVRFTSLGAARLSAYLLRRDGERCPLLVHTHGYGDRCEVREEWARAGFHVLGVDVRGFGRSRTALPAPSPYGWILSGISTPETSVLRGAVCDLVRAVEVGRALLGEAAGGLVLHGTSMAGGLALMAEASRPAARLLSLAVPSFGWTQGRLLLVAAGSGFEVTEFLARLDPAYEDDVLSVLRYFDPMNHAGGVHAPAVVGVGRVDAVVPAPTVYAVVNHLPVLPEVWQLPVSHTDLPAERLWQQFEARWLEVGLAQASAASATASRTHST